MKKLQVILLFICSSLALHLTAQENLTTPAKKLKQPNTSKKGWKNLFGNNLENAMYTQDVWIDSNGIITARKDESIWSKEKYDDFILDLDFQTADGTNSGVIVHATETEEWIPHSVEIQIADDYSAQWSKAAPTWQCGAIFGHKAATNKKLNHAGEWNHYTITCIGKNISIALNEIIVNECNMDDYTSSKKNPDGTDIPSWLSNPMSTLALHGYIGLQGKHAGAPIYFKNIKIKKLS